MTQRLPYWWLDTTWLRHRHAIAAVHPLLVALEGARSLAFLTCGHVLDVLDARDPEVLVRSWIDGVPVRRQRLGLPAKVCAWQKGDETCARPVRAVNAKFCEFHAAASKRQSNRETWHRRTRKSSPSPALGNHAFAEGADPLPSIQVFGKQRSPSTAVLEG